MMNEILYQDQYRRAAGRRPGADADAAWGLLSQGLTGFDWHGGYYAPPPRLTAAPVEGARGLGAWLRARRGARELARLSAREREDARLPQPAPRPASRLPLWERVAAWAGARTLRGPCPDGRC